VEWYDYIDALTTAHKQAVLDAERRTCECETNYPEWPEGHTCGNPDCYRTKRAEHALAELCRDLQKPKQE
jgi:hypothetical protein